VIKAALIADPDLLDHLLSHGPIPIERDRRTCRARVKIDIVQQDPLETGIRAVLNLGHTFGHALEQVSSYRWRHGEAVALGRSGSAPSLSFLNFARQNCRS
jgi:3-dehydroquinate synthetase